MLELRNQFPNLNIKVNGYPLIYLDNGATAQKPKSVIDTIDEYYKTYNSNVHRGVHFLSQKATDRLESVRKRTQAYINAENEEEIIFTKGTTDGINLVAFSYAERFLQEGDEIILTRMEHHSNIVPWQMACERKGAKIRLWEMEEDGSLDLEKLERLISSKTRLLAICHISNALGTINPIKEIVESILKPNGIHILVDGAQAVPHTRVNVQDLAADFYVFSSHKIFGPTGVGVLYGKKDLLNELPPYQGGGDMIKDVSFEGTTYNELPHKFEAGTPNIAGIIGLGAAIDFMNSWDWELIHQHEDDLLSYATDQLKEIQGAKIYGEAKQKASILSFNIADIHPYDIGSILDQLGIAVRTGHHCTQPIMEYYKIPGTVRASFAAYNNKEDVDRFFEALHKSIKMLS
ncbi:MAG: cysteine desulfurase [Flavobacteriales bacterium]|nr:cysteine desulfurase [Flavobacteriales bacterium]